MRRSARRSTIVRSGVVGFVADVAALGVAASASPVHGVVSSAVQTEVDGWSTLLGHDRSSVPATSTPQVQQQPVQPQQDVQPQAQQQPYVQPQQQPYVQPQPQQAPQSRAS